MAGSLRAARQGELTCVNWGCRVRIKVAAWTRFAARSSPTCTS